MEDFERYVREELEKIEEEVTENTERFIRLETIFDEYRKHTYDKRQMVKSFIFISLGIVGTIIAYIQLSQFV